MDSLIGYDKTLPIDLDGSTNPDLLTEVTFGGHMEYPDGSVPMVAKTNSGRMSPVRGRTMREYDQLIGELKKENFDLKLRIYYMEERMHQKHGKEDEFKINVGLKVELQRHKNELIEKQNLLKEASDTINKMSQNFSAEVEAGILKYREEYDIKLEEEKQRADDNEKQFEEAQRQLQELDKQCKELEEGLQQTKQHTGKLQQTMQELNEQLASKDKKLEEHENELVRAERQIKEAKSSAQKIEEQLREELEKQMTNVGRRDRDIKDEVDNQRRSLEKLQKKNKALESDSTAKDEMIGKLEDLLREKDKDLKGLEDRKEQLEKDLDKMKTKFKQVAFELTNSVVEKTREAEEKGEAVDKLHAELNKTKNALHLANMERHKEVEALTSEKAELADHAEALESRLNDQDKQLENLLQLLGNKDGELEGFKNLLKTAEMSLDKSESAVQKLQEELRKEQARHNAQVPTTADIGVQVDDPSAMSAIKDLENALLKKLSDLNSVAHKLDITVGNVGNPGLQQILEELRNLGKAVQGDQHITVEVNSTHTGDQSGANGVNRSPTSAVKTGMSRIPVRKTSSTSSSSDELDGLKKQCMELQARNKNLENTLRATEETVRQQTQKMKHYKNMLVDHGLLPRNLSRCNSDPNLANISPSRPMASQEKFSSSDNLFGARRCLSPSPTLMNGRMSSGSNLNTSPGNGHMSPSNRYMSPSNSRPSVDSVSLTDSLKQENNKLREQVEGYRRMLKVFQGRSPSPPSDDSKGSGRRHNTSSMFSKAVPLEDWLNSLEQLLQELSQGDQDAFSPPVAQISRIRRGLGDARDVLKSLKTPANQVEAVSSTQRSPDAGSFPPSSGPGGLVRQSPLRSTPCAGQSGMVSGVSAGSIERMRGRVVSGQNDIDHNLFKDMSLTDNSVFAHSISDGNGAVHDGNGTTCHSDKLTHIHSVHSNEPSSRSHMAPSTHDVTSFCDKTFMPGFLDNVSDLPLNDTVNQTGFHHSRFLDLEDMSVDLDCDSGTSISHVPSLEMEKLRHRAEVLENVNESLKKDLKFYQSMMGSGGAGNVAFDGVLNQHLEELRALRKKLENKLEDSDDLEKLLKDSMNKPKGPDPAVLSHEATIRDLQQLIHNLRQQLADCQNSLHQKVRIIEEKERVIKDLNVRLVKQRDQAAKDSSEVEMYRDTVRSMDTQIKQCQEKEEKFNRVAKQLKDALEQYKRRVEQLEGDVKQHSEVSLKSQRRAFELEEELHRTKEERDIEREESEKQKAEFKVVLHKCEQLEADCKQCRESEENCRAQLGQSRLKLTELTDELATLRERVKCQNENTNHLRAELDESAKRYEEQLHKIHESVGVIEQQKRDLDERNHAIKQMEAMAREQNQKVEGHAALSSQLTLRLEQERKLVIEHKHKLEKQSEIIRDFERKLEYISGLETNNKQQKEDFECKLHEKDQEIKLATDKKDKYLSNLKKTLRELKRTQIELKSLRLDLKERSDLNRTLKLELSVHEKLSAKESFSPDDKQNMILQLLNEIKLLRAEMEKMMERNAELRKTMEKLLANPSKDASPPRSQGTDATDGHPSPGRPRTRLSDIETLDKEMLMSKFSPHLELHADILESPDTTASSDSGNIEGADQTGSGSNRSFPGNVTWPGTLELSQSNQSGIGRLCASLPLGGDTSGHFSIPGPLYSQKVTDRSLTYHVDDSPQYLSGLTQVRIDSDLRSLFAIGKIDDFEKLRKELSEALILVKGMMARINDRLQFFNRLPASEIIKSLEYSTLKELSLSTENLRICLDEENSLIGCFWCSELPAPNERGEFVNQRLQNELETLRQNLQSQKTKYEYMCRMVEEANQRLHVANLQKICYEQEICHSLETTTEVISMAKQNLQSKWDYRTATPDGTSNNHNISGGK